MKNILMLTTLIFALVFTSLRKNKTRLLEKELVSRNNEISSLTSNLSEATLDFEYLTTPKNISFLANNYLDESFSYYKKKQINNSSEQKNNLKTLNKLENINVFSQSVLFKQIKKNSRYTEKYNNKKLIVAKFDNQKSLIPKIENKHYYLTKKKNDQSTQKSNNKVVSKKVQRWVGLQIFKAFLGIPTLSVK